MTSEMNEYIMLLSLLSFVLELTERHAANSLRSHSKTTCNLTAWALKFWVPAATAAHPAKLE